MTKELEQATLVDMPEEDGLLRCDSILEEHMFVAGMDAEFKMVEECTHAWLYAISDDHDHVMIGDVCKQYIADKSGMDKSDIGTALYLLNRDGVIAYVRNNLAHVHRPQLEGK